MKKVEILKKSITAVEARSATHGPELRQSFYHVAQLWSAYLGCEVNTEDVPQMLALLKMSRAKKGDAKDPDHYVDQAGYAAIAGELNSVES